jgi:hypothetical protein
VRRPDDVWRRRQVVNGASPVYGMAADESGVRDVRGNSSCLVILDYIGSEGRWLVLTVGIRTSRQRQSVSSVV